MKSKKGTKAKAINGKTSADCADKMDIIHRVWEARQICGMSFAGMETAFGLRDNNGMVSYRLFNKARKLVRQR